MASSKKTVFFIFCAALFLAGCNDSSNSTPPTAGPNPAASALPSGLVAAKAKGPAIAPGAAITVAPTIASVPVTRDTLVKNIKNRTLRIEILNDAKFNEALYAGKSRVIQEGKVSQDDDQSVNYDDNYCFMIDEGLGSAAANDQFNLIISCTDDGTLGVYDQDGKFSIACLNLSKARPAFRLSDLEAVFGSIAKISVNE